MVRAMVYVLALFFWAVSLKAEPILPEVVLHRVEDFYLRTQTLSGAFTQEVYWRKKLEVETSGGRFWFSKPDLLRWEYDYPEKLVIVSDGKRVYYYSQPDAQVFVFDPRKAFSRLVLALLSGKARLSQNFRLLSGAPAERGFYFLELKPRGDQSVSRVKLKVELSTGEIREIWSWDPLGNLTHLVLKDLRINPRIDPQRFVFRIPRGVEVIQEKEGGS